MTAALRLSGIRKTFGRATVIRDVDLDIEEGEFIVFVGPSGCGKSTLLRLIAGLEEITAGDLFIADTRVNDVAPAKRGVAMVFQSYALYPHMSVFENIAFGLTLGRHDKAAVAEKVRAVAATLELSDLLDRLPKQLSGGQRQRVAIGRAIVREPRVFLFDEPLSNLDAALRTQMRGEIAALHQRLGTTMIYVTHDQVEAMTLADRIVVLNGGRVEQVGAPLDLYRRPANRFVAGFIGAPAMNFLPVAKLPPAWRKGGGAVTLGVRPEHLILDPEGPLAGTVKRVESLGDSHLLHIALEAGGDIVLRGQGAADVRSRQAVRLGADPGDLHFFRDDDSAISRA
ncbi:sn-glycerol-3-phosphate ABC transporter ATP-binding protein UgpC [Zavarzinia compransoris]|uniref:ABC transporter ATP-binding protein n=1 Tax=Zavarzinia marina TaxID=2911065 RepID=UPI001F20FC77|nr:sn-glycerol-3-phosphate ABC transporter ATP-binding protein UgpC [Zavarzinia marina]MCF4164704.1 sn-glycerol-3-phosphate ABC transporter ATP-binding protein UgpC [Zavarzinia marina]